MSERTVTSESELKAAITQRVQRIYVMNGELADQVRLLMKVSKGAFIAAGALLTTVVINLLTFHTEVVAAPLTGGTSTVLRFGHKIGSMVIVTSMIGAKTATALAALGVAFGGFGMVTRLYNEYRICESGASFVVLVRK